MAGSPEPERAARNARIVVGFDGSAPAERALERAAALGAGATITVVIARTVGVPGPGPAEEEERESEQALLGAALERLRARGVEASALAGEGEAADVIVAAARELEAGLVVVGRRGLNAAERLVLGSTSTKVLHHAPCDVLVVR